MNVIELRRYALKPGRRDELVALFDREFVESQEQCGMTLVGRYRDLDDPDAFVWIRGFDSMEQRKSALESFYERSPAWLAHRNAANATMIDSDNVLLLRPARDRSGFDLDAMKRGDMLAAVSVFMLADGAGEAALVERFEQETLPRLAGIAQGVAYFVTERSPNTYPRLPVRDGEWACVLAGLCADTQAVDAWHRIVHAPESLRLEPTRILSRR